MEMQLAKSNLNLCLNSLTSSAGCEYGLVRIGRGSALAILTAADSTSLDGFDGEVSEFGEGRLALCSLTAQNAATLRRQLPWLKPNLVGLSTSAGMGDRLGIATPGHVRALRDVQGGILPVFAQQSIREMQRTDRSPQQVIDDVTWGMFEEGWTEGTGADADHLKTTADIDACMAAGYTLFTIDPGGYVDNRVDQLALGQLRDCASRLPGMLQPRVSGLSGKSFDIEGYKLVFDEVTLLKAAVKYGKALAHVKSMSDHLELYAKDKSYEVEVSMDETDQPTSVAEHVYIAYEMKRLGLKWVSFAPRFIGQFEKGVDYIGDVGAFEETLAIHAAIARQFGPYKLSLHSGSDKFSLYGIFMEKTHGLAHLKTAGTSYLEALRTIAAVDADLFKEIYLFALERFNMDKQSYHVSAQVSNAPRPEDISDWPRLLDQFDAREILHVTFGSVLTEKATNGERVFYERMMAVLLTYREHYFDNLTHHFKRHLAPFSSLRRN